MKRGACKIQESATECAEFTEPIMPESVQSVKSVAMVARHSSCRCLLTYELMSMRDGAGEPPHMFCNSNPLGGVCCNASFVIRNSQFTIQFIAQRCEILKLTPRNRRSRGKNDF